VVGEQPLPRLAEHVLSTEQSNATADFLSLPFGHTRRDQRLEPERRLRSADGPQPGAMDGVASPRRAAISSPICANWSNDRRREAAENSMRSSIAM
jgi:hypothetical protein